jgi:NADH:ubiquinone oxidoreductase subunit 5 (subunit L)/multisubunit Na+/H+ antiporter MnhA subunit
LRSQKGIILHEIQTTPGAIKIYRFFAMKWHVDDFYNRFIVQKFINFGYHTSYKLFDAGFIAYLGPYGIAKTVTSVSKKFSQLQTGYVYHYAFIILVALVLMLFSTFYAPAALLSPPMAPA